MEEITINFNFKAAIMRSIRHYNHEKYWKMREEVINKKSKLSKIIRLFYFYRIQKMDAFNNAYMGTRMGGGPCFLTPPVLPHDLNGIVVSYRAKIGKNCTIYQQVTIGQENGKAPEIGDNCILGAGSKIIGGVKIGNNVKVGANAVVVKDVPDNCTAVGVPARIIFNEP